MDEDLAYQDAPWEELISGDIVLMSPRPSVNHNWIAGRIFVAFSNYLKGKNYIPFGDGTDVYLTKKDRVIPDVMIICRTDIIKKNGIHGAPDLVVEVLSPSTANIETYLLTDGKYVLDDVYTALPDDTDLTDEEKELYSSLMTFLYPWLRSSAGYTPGTDPNIRYKEEDLPS